MDEKNRDMNIQSRELLTRAGFREDFDPENRWILHDIVTCGDKKLMVSTVDLGIDHSTGFFKTSKESVTPLYYETMIFKVIGPDPEKNHKDIDFGGIYQSRYPTRDMAEAQHEYIVEGLKEGHITIDGDMLNFKYGR